MKIVGQDSCIHVVDDNTAAWQVLKDITESGAQDDAFYVVDVDEIVRRHKDWMQYLPRVKPYFAIKCNDTNVAVSVMAALGTGFDCASKMEIHKILKLGVDPRRIIFANPTKQMSHIRYAMTCGVDLMTFDNQDELNKIKAIYPTARLVLRIRCDSTKATYPLGSKAGAEMEDVEDILTVARELDMNVIGVSFHVGSGCSDPPVYVRGIQLAHSVFQIASKLGFNFTLLNVGGGFPGKIGSSIIEYADLINSALNIYFPEGDGIRFIAEPGRYFVESAYTLATCIHSRRLTRNKNGENIYMYYINDGIYGSFNGRIFDNAGSVATPVPLKAEGKTMLASVWGATCAGVDRVSSPIPLPELHIGDWLAFTDMGAYTMTLASNFNGMPIPRVHAIVRKAAWLVLRNRKPLTDEHFVDGDEKQTIFTHVCN